MTTTDKQSPCPCGRPFNYGQCCGRIHHQFAATGELTAPDAEALMRSRYSAYVLDLLDYLLATWHPSTRPTTLTSNEPGLQWLGLQVKKHVRQDAEHALVAFVARSKLGGRAYRLSETSRFERAGGVWFYIDGDIG
ncbi:YchJ family protein [Roseateles sp.]|uniref:YchJ family protein n=1 Tax=Roseateles sp. TaxID=1971397 RepID=UPI002869F88D|nr:YchJ family metal-binding protein [Roseateles sp.]